MLFANLWAQHGRDHTEPFSSNRVSKTSRKENVQVVTSFERPLDPSNESSFMSGEKIGISNATNSLERRIPVKLSPELDQKLSHGESEDEAPFNDTEEERIIKIDYRSSPFKEDSTARHREAIFKIDTNRIDSIKAEKPNSNNLSSKYKIEDDETTFFSHRSLFPRKLLQKSRFFKRGDSFIDDHHNRADLSSSRLEQSENLSGSLNSELRDHFFNSMNTESRNNKSIFYDSPEEDIHKSKISFDRQDSHKLARRPRFARLFSRFRSGSKVESCET